MKDQGLSLAHGVAWNAVGSLVYSVANWLTTVLVVVLGDSLELSGNSDGDRQFDGNNSAV